MKPAKRLGIVFLSTLGLCAFAGFVLVKAGPIVGLPMGLVRCVNATGQTVWFSAPDRIVPDDPIETVRVPAHRAEAIAAYRPNPNDTWRMFVFASDPEAVHSPGVIAPTPIAKVDISGPQMMRALDGLALEVVLSSSEGRPILRLGDYVKKEPGTVEDPIGSAPKP